MTLEQLEAFYITEYPKLVKILVLLDATIEEAEDAAQKAMADFAKRSKTAGAPDHPASYVRRRRSASLSRSASASASGCRARSGAATW